MTRQRLHKYGVLLVYGIALLLCLFAVAGCSSTQWGRFKAHGSAVGIGVIAGGAAVATGGTAGLLIATGGLGAGVIVDQTLEPEPEVHSKTTVVFIQPAGLDGKPARPVVHTFDDSKQGALKLPGGLGGLPLPNPETFAERAWRALQIVWWVGVALVVLANDKLRGALWGVLCWAVGFLGRKAAQLTARLKRTTPRP